MHSWEALFGLDDLDAIINADFHKSIRPESELDSVQLALSTGLLNALKHVADQRALGKTIYPPDADIFNSFKLTTPSNLKVVIIGQDPYHGENQAHGLCFSVRKGNKIPPSLRNIYKELSADIPNFTAPEHGDLSYWAEQGVLLLNTVLSVEHAQAHSHKKVGWEMFTDSVITTINKEFENVIFLLWGAPAQKKATLINESRHSILTAVHPSPLSAHRGFFGCKHFSQTNEILKRIGKQEIDWQPK
jgi:uracil-DNA glycosylase